MGLDAVEIVLEIEEQLGIRFEDDEAERIETVGQLYEYALSRMADRDHAAACEPARTDVCLSAVVFYRLRRELCAELDLDRRQIRPTSRLDELIPRPGRRRMWAKMRRTLDLALPQLVRPWWFLAVAAVASPVLGLLKLWPFAWLPVLSPSALAVYLLTRPLANRFPPDCTAVADLCHAVVEENYRRLVAEFTCFTEDEVFQKIKMILVDALGVEPSEITPQARLVADLGMC